MTVETDHEVRDGRAADARSIGEIHAAAWAAGFVDLFERDVLALLVARRRAMWTAMFDAAPMRRTRILLAAVDSEAVAFVHFGPAGVWDGHEQAGQGEIYGFYAHPSAWGSGAAGRLMSAALARLAGDGFEPVSLWTLKDASRARHFYAQHGFNLTGQDRPVDFGDGRPRTEIEYRH